MPYLKIQTNVAVPAPAGMDVLAEASRSVADLLGKPESYVMVSLQAGQPMLFAGNDAPLAYLELKSIGLPEAQTPALSQALCELLNRRLNIPPDRIYIEFANAPARLWGWNSGTF